MSNNIQDTPLVMRWTESIRDKKYLSIMITMTDGNL